MKPVERFTVVTVCLNARDSIRLTLESVARQSFAGMEHVIVDGGSTDGTLDILAEHPDLKVRSGPDGGVYDAMDRGRSLVRGDIAMFLNAGDCFFDDATAEALVDFFRRTPADIVFGNILPVYLRAGDTHDHDAFRPGHVIDLGFMRNRRDLLEQSIHHQATVYRRELLEACTFACRKAPHAMGEYHLLLEAALRRNARIRHFNRTISRFALGGISTRDFDTEWRKYLRARDSLREIYGPTPESIRIDGPDEFHGILPSASAIPVSRQGFARWLRQGPAGRAFDRALDAAAKRVLNAIMPRFVDLLESQVQRLFNDLDARVRTIVEASEARMLARGPEQDDPTREDLLEAIAEIKLCESRIRSLLNERARRTDLRPDDPIAWDRALQDHGAAMIRHEDRLLRPVQAASPREDHPRADDPAPADRNAAVSKPRLAP
jgi:hypothetical protein